MNDEGYPVLADGLKEHLERLRDADLTGHAFELDQLGYTVLPALLPGNEVEELSEALLRLGAEDEGQNEPLSDQTHRDRTQEVVLLLTRGGDAFKRLATHPTALLLAEHLLGEQRVLSSLTGYVKGPGQSPLGMHSDSAYIPDPVPLYAQLMNINYCLTEYSAADGGLMIVPGSHRYGHRPREGTGGRGAISIVAPPGSAIVFHGNTWHSATPRTNPGLRLTLSVLYSRMYLRPQERYAGQITRADEERFPGLSQLAGDDLPTGWGTLEEARTIMARRKERGRQYYSTRAPHA